MTVPKGTFIYSDAIALLDVVEINRMHLVRPKGQLGTCGSYPFVWDSSTHRVKEVAQRLFVERHHAAIANHLENHYG